MESTTLVTFLLNSIPSSHSVQLLGSWDNFSTSYPMQKDRQTGHGHWVGCHSFKNIICDGDPSRPVQRRDGGLKTGGTYWYYYKLNGDIEYHDPSRPSTNACPLLPGQTVNVLELPVDQSTLPGADSEYVEIDKLLTRDPHARYVKPVPLKKRKRLDVQHQQPLAEQQGLSRVHKEWLAKSTGRLQTALVDTVIHALGNPRQKRSNSLQGLRQLRSAPATVQQASAESEDTERDLLSRMDSWRSSARRPHARRGPATKDGTMSRTASTKSVFHWDNPFLQSNTPRENALLSSLRSEKVDDDVEDQVLSPRPATWNGHVAQSSRSQTFEAVDWAEKIRPSSAPLDFFESTKEETILLANSDAQSLEERLSMGRLSAIIEVEAETSFGPDGEVHEIESNAHQSESIVGSPDTTPEMKRGDSKKGLRAKSSAMFSRRASKRLSHHLSRSSSLTESVQSLDHTAAGSQADDSSFGTSVRTSTSSTSAAGWASPPFLPNIESIDGVTRPNHLGRGNTSKKKFAMLETRLSQRESGVLSEALDSQETIRPMGMGKGSSIGTEIDYRSKEQERTFSELIEHVEAAFESGRFERRFSFSNEPDSQADVHNSNQRYHVNSADFYHSTLDEAKEPADGDLQVCLPHDDIFEELSYLGSLIV